MKIAIVASEVYPYAKTGGLADVAGALPKSLEKLGCEVKIFLPKYYTVDENKFNLHYNWGVGEMPIRVAGHVRSVHIHQGKLPDSNVEVNFIDCPHYFHRSQVYTNDPDEDERFILLCKGTIETLQRLQWVPDVIHCNDWQTGLIPLFIKDNYSWDKIFQPVSTLFTIHNIGYQGRFPGDMRFKAELRDELFHPGSPFESEFSFMRAGIIFSDIINTVSDTYAHEILTPEFGAGMENILYSRKDDLFGIVNGVDYEIWNPETDNLIPFHYSVDNVQDKIKNKQYLLELINLPFKREIPVIGIISRMVSQKGFDIVAGTLKELIDLPAQWVILGSGEDRYEDLFRSIGSLEPDKVFTYIGYNNEFAHLVVAGVDMMLMPSHYEPCGLIQLYGLRYGNVPVVRKTGGLADTVKDWHEFKYKGFETGTGFSFNDYTSDALYTTVRRAVETFNDKNVWLKIQQNGMNQDYSWEHSAKEYIELYAAAITKRKQ
jgi:starch synthase